MPGYRSQFEAEKPNFANESGGKPNFKREELQSEKSNTRAGAALPLAAENYRKQKGIPWEKSQRAKPAWGSASSSPIIQSISGRPK